jgi:S-adenosylmethionine-diacylglycerol 3-amino-3-carboxypropyl transferase
MDKRFFSTLNYSSVNEDWRTEAEALRITGRDRVLCITGSGARPLDLLMHNPAHVVAIDKGPAQNHLLNLKMAAMRLLPFGDYAGFIGLAAAPGKRRIDMLNAVSGALEPGSRRYWNEHRRIIRAGVLYQGRWERNYRRVSAMARFIRPRLISRLFACEEIEEQRVFLRTRWDSGLWRTIYRIICSPLFSRLFFRDPAFYRHVAVAVPKLIYDRMYESLERYPARENFMISLVLTGKLPGHGLPPHLTAEGCATIVNRLGCIEPVTSDILDYLHYEASPRFTRYSMSDVPSYMSASGFEKLLSGIVRTAGEGSRVVIRQFLTRYETPAGLAASFIRDRKLEERLAREDRAFAYQFFVAEVTHG